MIFLLLLAQIIGPSRFSGAVAAPPSAAITFSPAAGTYTGSQTVTISGPAGKTLFYTTDGSTPTVASTLYSAPITVAATEEVNVIAAATGSVNQNTSGSSTGWKCNTVDGGTSNGITCIDVGTGGGVGTIQPSAWNMLFGPTASFLTSTTSTTGETQMLNIFTGAGCDSCTQLSEDLYEEAVGDDTVNANVESDVWQVDDTHEISSTPVLHMCGLQCNQQPGNPGNGYWQIDNEQGSWQNTTVTAGCPLSTTQYTHVNLVCSWTLGDTGCGGWGCTTFNTLAINGVSYALGVSLENQLETSWASSVGHQIQNDLTNTVTAGTNPVNGGRYVQASSVTAAYATAATGTASYTIH